LRTVTAVVVMAEQSLALQRRQSDWVSTERKVHMQELSGRDGLYCTPNSVSRKLPPRISSRRLEVR
jgi:hypothetical protein